MLESIALLIIFIVSFATAFMVTPFIIRRMVRRNFVGKDMNKLGKPEIPEMGGISIIIGFSVSSMIAIAFYSYLSAFKGLELVMLLAGLLTIILVGLIGVFDDLIGWRQGIRQWQHALFPLFAALPLMALNVGQSNIVLPMFGLVNIGIIYSLIFVPIGITGASNAANMLAGLNGLEAGLGIINVTAILLAAFFLGGKIEAVLVGVALLGALIAFLYYNKFPAKIFPGDSLTLMVGAGIAAMVIIGDMERVGILLFAIYFAELLFKAKHKFQSQCFGIPQKNGILKADPKGGSLTQWVMRRGKFTEPQVVGIILAIQAVIAVIVLFLTFNKML